VPGAALIAASVFGVDYVLKRAVESSMNIGESVPLIPGVFHLTYIENPGGAFGILDGSPGILMIGSIIAVGAVLWMLLAHPPSRYVTSGCGLVLGGAAGNLFDRIAAGAVTDYLDFRIWPVFNAADVAIVAGALMLAAAAFRAERTRPEESHSSGE
jgi:signal peptidase II